MIENHLPIMTTRKNTSYCIRKNIKMPKKLTQIGIRGGKKCRLCSNICIYHQERGPAQLCLKLHSQNDRNKNSNNRDLQNRRHKWEINTLRVLCSPTNTTKKITQYNIRYMISQQKSKRKINKYCVLIIKGNKEADKAAKQAIDMPEMTTTRHLEQEPRRVWVAGKVTNF